MNVKHTHILRHKHTVNMPATDAVRMGERGRVSMSGKAGDGKRVVMHEKKKVGEIVYACEE